MVTVTVYNRCISMSGATLRPPLGLGVCIGDDRVPLLHRLTQLYHYLGRDRRHFFDEAVS